MPQLTALLHLLVALPLLASPAASLPASHTSELPSVLVIAKSSNRNQVHYAALVDDACAPVGSAPVRPYWQMLERGPGAVEPLSDREARVLGIARQEVGGGSIVLALRGMPERTFTVHTGRGADGRCASWADTRIAGGPARVTSIFAQQKLFGVDYILLTGVSAEGTEVRERVSP